MTLPPEYENVKRQSKAQSTRWSFCHCIGILLATILCVYLQLAAPVIIWCVFSFGVLWWRNAAFLQQYRFFAGPANWITAARFATIAYVLTSYEILEMPVIVALLSVAVLMDAIDGYVARRNNFASEFGAIFDMEADSFYVLAMGLYFYFTTDFGLWLLIPGCIRYVYDIVRIVFVDAKFEARRQPLAVLLAGVNFVLLLTALLVPNEFQMAVLSLSLVVVCTSFGRSFLELVRYAIR